MTTRREFLVLLGSDQALSVRVTQRVSQRVVIVEAEDAAAMDELRSHALAVLEPGDVLPSHLRDALNETEALFVDAFARRTQVKTRTGDGLSWDAYGFLPPDPPKKK
jgi:hypothetical protein